jgi:hypothetical protein
MPGMAKPPTKPGLDGFRPIQRPWFSTCGLFNGWQPTSARVARQQGQRPATDPCADYLQPEKPPSAIPQRYASVDASPHGHPGTAVEANKMCMDDMMAIDAGGGMGKPGSFNLASSPAVADRAAFHHRPWPQVCCVHVQRASSPHRSRRKTGHS